MVIDYDSSVTFGICSFLDFLLLLEGVERRRDED